jgi:hypothetical protein
MTKKKSKPAACGPNELFFQAIRMDESRFLQDSEEGKKLLKKYGKIYAVYLWTPDVGVHIASLTPSAELWLVDYTTDKLGRTEAELEAWDDLRNELMRDSESVTYMNYRDVERMAEDKKNVRDRGCYEIEGEGDAEDRARTMDAVMEDYHGNPSF